jgi:hypothetical protein
MKIEEMTTEKLKAIAYDVLIAIQKSQNDLMMINQELNRRKNETTKQGREKVDGEELEKKQGRTRTDKKE